MARLENTVSVESFFCPFTEVFAFFSMGEISALKKGVNKIFSDNLGSLDFQKYLDYAGQAVWSHIMYVTCSVTMKTSQ